MKLFKTEQEKKSIIITTSSFVLLFLLFFFLKFSDSLPLPEMEGGGGGGEIAVNFGDSDLGSGENFDSKEIVTAAPEEVVETPTEEKEIVVSENEEAPAIAEIKKPDTKIEKKEEDKPVVKPSPKPSKSTSDALSNLLNGSNKEGDGNDKTAGNKGKSNGDTNSKGYNGGGGSGTGSGGGNGHTPPIYGTHQLCRMPCNVCALCNRIIHRNACGQSSHRTRWGRKAIVQSRL